MANRWYVALEGEELGPLSDTGLERLIQGEKIDSETLVRNGADGEWMPAYLAEEMLAARPSRQRPGEAAIQAARRSKQAAARSRLPPAKLPPTNSPSTQASTPSAAPAPATPPAELRPPALPATNGAPQSPSTPAQSPPAAAGSPSAQPAPNSETASGETAVIQPPAATRSALVWLRAGAAVLLLFAGSFYVGWLLVGSSVSVGNAAAASPIPSVSPQLAALRQEAEQLRREVAEVEQKLAPATAPEARPDAPSTPAPIESSPSADSPDAAPSPADAAQP